MRLSVTALTYWKTEHTIEDNEDAFAVDTHRGIFAISDGVGETSFAHEWAPIITNQFIENPLVSDDPFEVEHWVRQARKRARTVMTPASGLFGIAQTKARRGA